MYGINMGNTGEKKECIGELVHPAARNADYLKIGDRVRVYFASEEEMPWTTNAFISGVVKDTSSNRIDIIPDPEYQKDSFARIAYVSAGSFRVLKPEEYDALVSDPNLAREWIGELRKLVKQVPKGLEEALRAN